MIDIRTNICNCIDNTMKTKKLTNEGLASFVEKNEATVRAWRTHKIVQLLIFFQTLLSI